MPVMKQLLFTGLLVTLTGLWQVAMTQPDTLLPELPKPYVLGSEHITSMIDTGDMRVVSASRSAKYISELPVTIYVITHQEILENHYITLADALKSLPGVRVSQPGSGETGESFQIRGLTGNYYMKILVNNLPVKPSVVTGMPIASQLPVRQAERIEVIMGPASAVYGADAVSGVVNIILKEADQGMFTRGDTHFGPGFNYINFTIGGKSGVSKNIMQYAFYGSRTDFNNMNLTEGYDEAFNPLAYYQNKGVVFDVAGEKIEPLNISEVRLQSLGVQPGEFIERHYGEGYRGSLTRPRFEQLGTSSQMLGFNIQFRGVRLAYNNMYRQTHSSIGQSASFFRYDNPQNFWGESIHQLAISYGADWERFATTTNLLFLTYRMDNNSSLGLTRLPNDRAYIYSAADDMMLEQLFTLFPLRNLEIVSGFTYQVSGNLPVTNYRNDPFPAEDYALFRRSKLIDETAPEVFGYHPLLFHNVAGFVQSYYIYGDFRLMGGMRYDVNSLYGNRFSPRIALLYVRDPVTSYTASLGYAFKAPPSSMAYQSFALPAGQSGDSLKYLMLPNSGLEPEKYMSVEAGVRTRVFSRIDTRIELFYNVIGNLITETAVPVNTLRYPLASPGSDSLWATTRINSTGSVSRLYGAQANLRMTNIVRSLRMDGELNLTIAHQSEDLPTVGGIIGSFGLQPRHLGQLKLFTRPTDRLTVSSESFWVSKWLRLLIPFEELYNEMFSNVDGYFTMDVAANYSFSDNLRGFLRVNNLFNEKYGGLSATGFGMDLPVNPQLGRHIRFGLIYALN